MDEVEDEYFGWHLDSLKPEYKLFCYLTEVSDQNGPTEIIEGTASMRHKLHGILNGAYFRPTDIWSKGKRQYMNIDKKWMNKIFRKFNITTMRSVAGESFLVNTSTIHRAKPCVCGQRYALTLYLRRL